MKTSISIISIFLILTVFTIKSYAQYSLRFYAPVNIIDRSSIDEIEITKIGEFGLLRKDRENVPAHLHTGLDIKRPNKKYNNEPIYSISDGIVVSIRDDGPFAQVIIEHVINDSTIIWSVYEHLSGICVDIYENVNPMKPIGRFMNKEELSDYGWHFDHLHIEILKIEPRFCEPTQQNPKLFFKTYWGDCFTTEDLNKYYYHPLEFLNERMIEWVND